jgi:hypothetical protein
VTQVGEELSSLIINGPHRKASILELECIEKADNQADKSKHVAENRFFAIQFIKID